MCINTNTDKNNNNDQNNNNDNIFFNMKTTIKEYL